jgi:hypothetical protein
VHRLETRTAKFEGSAGAGGSLSGGFRSMRAGGGGNPWSRDEDAPNRMRTGGDLPMARAHVDDVMQGARDDAAALGMAGPAPASTAEFCFAFKEAVAAYAVHPCQVNALMVEMTVLALLRQKERAAALARWRGLAR